MLREKEGTPQEILDNNELMQVLLPTICADFQVAQTYEYQFKHLLHCPITVFAGTEEKSSDEDFCSWKYETSKNITFKRLPGGHFFIYSEYKFIINTMINAFQQSAIKSPNSEFVTWLSEKF